MKLIELQSKFSLDSFRVAERPQPKPGYGQVLVKVRACSLNYRDLLIATGAYDPRIRLPLVPLSDGAGEVVELGEGAKRFKTGDRVAACFMPRWIDGELTAAKASYPLGASDGGMLADFVALPEEGLVPIPNHLLECPHRPRQAQSGRQRLGSRHRRSFSLRITVRQEYWLPRHHHIK